VADQDHERGLGHVLALQAHDREDPRCEIIDYADHAAGVLATSGRAQLNPYKLGVELYRNIEERWDKGQFGKEWEDCDDLDAKKNWNLRLGLGQEKIFEVRALYNDVTFIDEFLTPDFVREHKLFSFSWSNRNERYEIETREFKAVKEKLLFQLTNGGNPFIYVETRTSRTAASCCSPTAKLDYAREVMLQNLLGSGSRPVNLHHQGRGQARGASASTARSTRTARSICSGRRLCRSERS
jgi:stage V sporulation protein R